MCPFLVCSGRSDATTLGSCWLLQKQMRHTHLNT
jgi:hypothetical protein